MRILLVILLVLSMTVSVYATEGDDIVVVDDEVVDVYEDEDDFLTMEGLISDLDQNVVLPNSSESEDIIISDIIESDQPVLFALVGSNGIYNQAWSGSVLDYFLGIVSKDPFCDYVIYRSDNSAYYCWYGDISLDNGYFSGTDLNVVYYEASSYNSPIIRYYTGNLSISAEGFIYSNLGEFSDLSNNQEVRLIYVEIVSICILIGLSIIKSILRTT